MKKLVLCILFAAIALVPYASAAKNDKDKKHSDAFMPGAADDSRIVKQVRHELLMLPYFGVFDDLGFEAQGGVVTLVGDVTRPTLKSDAGNVVKRIEGV